MIPKSNMQLNQILQLRKDNLISLQQARDHIFGVGGSTVIDYDWITSVVKKDVSDTVIKADRALRLIHNTQGPYKKEGFRAKTIIINLFDDEFDSSCFIIKLQHDTVTGVSLRVVTDDDLIEIDIELPPTGSGYANKFNFSTYRIPEPGFNLIGELTDFIEDYRED